MFKHCDCLLPLPIGFLLSLQKIEVSVILPEEWLLGCDLISLVTQGELVFLSKGSLLRQVVRPHGSLGGSERDLVREGTHV